MKENFEPMRNKSSSKNSSANLSSARKAKNDEFYTQLTDIENELKYYKEQFKDKVVFCNCDDPEESDFWKYFALNFEFLGLRKLIATHFEIEKPAYKLEIAWGIRGRISRIASTRTPLRQNGDFRSPECVELLKEADIIVTNPPFSLFREYVAQLTEYNKNFVIIGNLNAITYRETFKLIKKNKMWLGQSIHSGDREFRVPEYYPLNAASNRIDENGNKYIRVKGVRWFTNLDYNKRHEDLILYKKYNPEEYPSYENYEAINVDKTNDIPCDYKGVMGVPISFLDKYNPEQFEIIGLTHSGDKSKEVEVLRKDQSHRNRGIIHGETKYARILIKTRGASI